MKWTKLKKLTIENFGPFIGKHEIEFPDSGLTLLRGKVIETGDGSGAGKSYLLNALSYLFGGCPFAATDLQSWFTTEEPKAEGLLETEEGEVKVTRYKGLTVKSPKYSKGIKGEAAKPVLDEIFGMNEKVRALCTYRGQKERGMFIAMADSQKKSFLSDLLDLNCYEKVAYNASEKAKQLQIQVTGSRARLESAQEALRTAQNRLFVIQAPDTLGKEKLSADLSVSDSMASQFEANAAIEQKLAQDVRLRLTADMEAEISILRNAAESQKPFEGNSEVLELENFIATLGLQIEDICKEDQKIQLALERQKGKLNEKLTRLKTSVSDLPRLKNQLLEVLNQKVSLEAQICPTCTRTWIDEKSKWLLDECVQKEVGLMSEIEVKEQEIQEGLKVKLEIEGLPPFVPNPSLAPLTQKQKDLTIQIGALRKKNQEEEDKTRRDNRAKEDLVRQKFSNQITVLSADHISKAGDYQKIAREKREESRRIERELGLLSQKAAEYSLAQRIVKENEEALDKVRGELDRAVQELNLELDIQAMVGREGFLGVIFEDILSEISVATNNILERVANVRHLTFQFETTKELKTGNVAQRITPVIYSHGHKVSFNAGISGGMQTSVELAVDLGVADVVARRRGTYPGFLILDEVFEGLGGVSKEAAMQMLEIYSKDRLVLIVDHSSEFQGLFQQIIDIEQNDGRSSIRS